VVLVAGSWVRVLGGWPGAVCHAGPGRGEASVPPEPDDARARRLEALRRYVAELGGQRDGPAVEGAEPQPASGRRRRPSRPWLLLTGLLVAVALVGGVLVGAVAWSDDRRAGGGTGTGASSATQRPATTAGAMASAACKTAVDRANTMLASTVKLRRALAEQARILRDPTNRRLSGPEVLEKLAPWLQAGRASRPGSTGPWPITGGSWTSASCRPPEPGGQVRAPGWQRRSRWTGSARRWRRSPRRRSPAAAPGSGWGSRRRRSGTGPWDTARSAGR
jgi:hypothetical protein